MKNSFKFSVAMISILMTLLSGCVFPGEGWGGGDYRGGGRGGDDYRGNGHGGDRGGENGDRR